MSRLAPLAILSVLLVGCSGLTDWMNAPANQPLVIQDDATGAAIELTLPEGTPIPGQPAPVTRGDKIANSVGPIVTALTGNPFLALLLGGAAAGVSNRAKKKKA